VVGSAFKVLNWHGPVLVEWSAEDGVVYYFNDYETEPDVAEEPPEGYLVSLDIAARKIVRMQN